MSRFPGVDYLEIDPLLSAEERLVRQVPPQVVRQRGVALEHLVQREDLRPVGVLGAQRVVVDGRDRGLHVAGGGHIG